MTGNNVALDTSAAVRILNDSQLTSHFLANYERVCISAIAAGELLYGAHNSLRHAANIRRFQAFIDDCEFIPISREIAETYARIRLRLKTRGFPIPEPDIWIAATSIHLAIPLVTADRHFSYVEGLVMVSLTP